jgi:hypothetical protein
MSQVIRSYAMSKLCWYCEKNQAHKPSTVKVDLHYYREKKVGFKEYKVGYENKTIYVPCCEKCKSLADERVNKRMKLFWWIVSIAFITIIIGGVIFWIYTKDFFSFVCLGMIIFPIAFVVLIVSQKNLDKDFSGLNRNSDYPAIKKLLDDGFKYGHRT